MITRFAILIFLLFTSLCQAKYSPRRLSQLIDESDLIGSGEIIQIKGKYITVKFTEFVKGYSKTQILNINQFENWTCASRWTKYKTGQKELIFLKLSKSKEFEILGSGNEGEMPIYNNSLYYKSPYGCLDKEAKQYKFNHLESLCGFEFKISDAKDGIREYLKNRTMYINMAKTKSKNKILKNRFLERLVYEQNIPY